MYFGSIRKILVSGLPARNNNVYFVQFVKPISSIVKRIPSEINSRSKTRVVTQ